MHFSRLPLAIITLLASALTAEVTPMDAPLKVDGTTLINVQYPGGTIDLGRKGYRVEAEAAPYSYKLYLPPGYDDDPSEKFPVFFFFSPGGNASMYVFGEAMKRERMIGVMCIEAKNGDWDPIWSNFIAAHDDVMKRCRVEPDFKFATGFSGGGRMAHTCSMLRPGFVGVVTQGAGFSDGGKPAATDNPRMLTFWTYGREDDNRKEIARNFKELSIESPTYHLFFPGGHGQLPEPLADEVMNTLTRWAYYDLAPVKSGKAIYTRIFTSMLDQIDAAEEPFEKFDLTETAIDYAKGHDLSTDKSLAPKVAELKKSLTTIPKSPTHAKQLLARKSFAKASQGERNFARAVNGVDANYDPTLQQLKDVYKFTAEKYPQTLYGTKAAKRLEELEARP